MPVTGYTIDPSAARHAADRSYTFRVDATIIATRRGTTPTRNLDWDSANRYADHMAGTGRYSDIRITLDTF